MYTQVWDTNIYVYLSMRERVDYRDREREKLYRQSKMGE